MTTIKTFDRKTYYTQKYGPDYFKTIGRKGGKSNTVDEQRRAGVLGGNSLARRVYATDPDYYSRIKHIDLDRIKKRQHQQRKMFGWIYLTCDCGRNHRFKGPISQVVTCSCQRDVLYIAQDDSDV